MAEDSLAALAKAQARLARLRLLDNEHDVEISENRIQRVPRQRQQVEDVLQVSDETLIRRFLIIGSAKSSYNPTAEKITMDNAKTIVRIIEEGNGMLVLKELSLINSQNRNPKMSPMLFTLALCARYVCHDTTSKKQCPMVSTYSDYISELHSAAFKLLPEVCRLPTHLFEFVGYCEYISAPTTGWGRAMRTAITDWYRGLSGVTLAMHLTKYPQHEGWSHRDVFRLAHPCLAEEEGFEQGWAKSRPARARPEKATAFRGPGLPSAGVEKAPAWPGRARAGRI